MTKLFLLLMATGLFISCSQNQKQIDNFNALQRKELPSILAQDTVKNEPLNRVDPDSTTADSMKNHNNATVTD